jgi:hypothetical protein
VLDTVKVEFEPPAVVVIVAGDRAMLKSLEGEDGVGVDPLPPQPTKMPNDSQVQTVTKENAKVAGLRYVRITKIAKLREISALIETINPPVLVREESSPIGNNDAATENARRVRTPQGDRAFIVTLLELMRRREVNARQRVGLGGQFAGEARENQSLNGMMCPLGVIVNMHQFAHVPDVVGDKSPSPTMSPISSIFGAHLPVHSGERAISLVEELPCQPTSRS